MPFLAFGLVGCTSVQTPTARITNVSVAKQTSQGARVNVTVQVSNPNDFTLPVTSADYHVHVAGLKTFDFHTIPSKYLPANGKQTFEFPASFQTPNRPIYLRMFNVSGQFAVQPPGKLWLVATESGWPRPKINFSDKGRLLAGQTQPTDNTK